MQGSLGGESVVARLSPGMCSLERDNEGCMRGGSGGRVLDSRHNSVKMPCYGIFIFSFLRAVVLTGENTSAYASVFPVFGAPTASPVDQ